jgi:hypothetical protein
MSYKFEEKEGSLYVTGHVGPGRKGDAPSVITTQHVLTWLKENHPSYTVGETLQGGQAHNAGSEPQRTNVWVFSYSCGNTPSTLAQLVAPIDDIDLSPPPSPPITNPIKKYRKVRKMRPKQN